MKIWPIVSSSSSHLHQQWRSPPLLPGYVLELRGSTQRPSAYKGADLLAYIAKFVATAIVYEPSLISQPASLAATATSGAVSALKFAPLDSISGSRPPDIETKMRGCMQYTADAVTLFHVLAQQLVEPSRTNAEAARSILTTREAAQSLVQLLLWLSEPTTAIATASGVLSEALPALRLMAADEEMRQMLAVEGVPHEWKPVAAALRRRLPRRMAARFLPEVDRVSAAVAGRAVRAPDKATSEAAAIAAAEAAMAELLQVCAINISCDADLCHPCFSMLHVPIACAQHARGRLELPDSSEAGEIRKDFLIPPACLNAICILHVGSVHQFECDHHHS